MFKIFGKNKSNVYEEKNNSDRFNLYACFTGKIIPIQNVPDPVFSQKILGDGFAIEPASNILLSPCDGRIIDITDEKHAYTIETYIGAELLIHVGLNAVDFGGKCFKLLVKVGDRIKQGMPICEVDFEMIKNQGYKTITPVIITNSESFKNITVIKGNAIAGKTICLTYEKL